MAAIAKVDIEVAEALPAYGVPPPRIRPPGFETFFSTIVSQQLSTAAAAAIMGRVRSLLPQISAAAVLRADEAGLRGAGLSHRKIEYVRGLAEALQQGQFDPDTLPAMSDTDAIATIIGQRGFGRWSAEIYLMFSLQRADIFPADDLAIRIALGRLKGLEEKPTPAAARKLTEHWAPWRSVGALFLWHFYRGAPT